MQDLKNKKIWVNWKSEERNGNKTKIPYNPHTGGKAQSNNPDTWATFKYAQSKSADYDGVGLMFADGICGIDIDNKEDNPDIEKYAKTIIKLMDSYAEYSPSGKGYHIIFKCDISKIPTINGKLDPKFYQKNPYNGIEGYVSGLTNRYFTFTGEAINNKEIEERTEQFLIFLDNYMLRDNFQKRKESEQKPNEHSSTEIKNNIDILNKARKAKNGIKFSALYDRGDKSDYNNDDSAADLALCNMLAFWLKGDFNEIDRYFRQSRLYRDKWERNDYKTNTINKAIDNCDGKYYAPPGRPKTQKNNSDLTSENNSQGSKDKISIAIVAEFLKQNGIVIKYNEITRNVDIEFDKIGIEWLDRYNNNYIVGNLPIIIYDQLSLIYDKCNKGDAQDFLRTIATGNAYNPVLELIKGNKWDGIDRLPELFRIMKIKDDDKLSKILICKWLWQNLSLLRNSNGTYGADGMLVLQGGQGLGKTTFARKMALKNEFFGESLILDVRNKDNLIRAVSCWIGEMGEIEGTFKSDINALKGFITSRIDEYRVPYGRTADKIPRRTSFIGTCNSDEYLIDETGSRRFWTVPVSERMDLNALDKFDAFQLYLQIDERAKYNIQGFRLTLEENTQLSERNSTHEKPIKSEFEVRDILFKAERDDLAFEEMTVTEFKELYPALKNYSANQVGTALKKVGIEAVVKKKDGKTQRLAKLPCPKNNYKANMSDF